MERRRGEPRGPGAGGREVPQTVANALRRPEMQGDRHKWTEAGKRHKMWQRDAKTQRSDRDGKRHRLTERKTETER